MRTKNQRGTFPTKDRTFILRDQKKRGRTALTEECAHEQKHIKEQDPKFLHFLETNQNKTKKIFEVFELFIRTRPWMSQECTSY